MAGLLVVLVIVIVGFLTVNQLGLDLPFSDDTPQEPSAIEQADQIKEDLEQIIDEQQEKLDQTNSASP